MNAYRVLIIGGSSYIGRYLASKLADKHVVFSTYYSHKSNVSSGDAIWLDIRDSTLVKKVLDAVRPDVVYLLAFSHSDLDGTVIKGASHVIESAEFHKSRVIFLSTDAVFSGGKDRYGEKDIPDAINEYGKAKRKAEKTVLEGGGAIVRTSLVYGFDPMDSRTLQLLRDLQSGITKTGYFFDEYRSPIFINDLCNMLIALTGIDTSRILHMAGPECISRLHFAQRLADAFGFDEEQVRSASLKESGLIHPDYLCIDSSLAQSILGCRIRTLEEILEKYIVKKNQ